MSINRRVLSKGFTIVELSIVIIVIGILAALVVVSYKSVQDDAQKESLDVDLKAAAKQMEVAVENGVYPSTLPSDVRTGSGNVLQLSTTSDGSEFCINGYSQRGDRVSYSSTAGIQDHLCDGAGTGSSIGGTVPKAPRGVNLAPGFASWTLTGGVSYDSDKDELVLSTSSGNAKSPLIRVDSPTSCRIALESYSTISAPGLTNQSRVHSGVQYLAADGVTPAKNSANYQSNGNAVATALNTWAPYAWTTSCGANVIYVRYTLNSSPTTYTSDNRLRNPVITAIGN